MTFGPKVVVTGAAGFIGMHLCAQLKQAGYEVIGIDNLHTSYGGNLAKFRQKQLEEGGIEIRLIDLADEAKISEVAGIFHGAKSVIHLAAWPGVKNGESMRAEYARANLTGFSNVLTAINLSRPGSFLFASSSSIYGDLGVGGPVKESVADGRALKSFYATTKWSNEVTAREFHEKHGIPSLALRFFTVYGEFGRPDMAYWIFLEQLLASDPVTLYGSTGGRRVFTYVLDACDRVIRLMEQISDGFDAFNVASGSSITTLQMLETLSKMIGVTPKIEFQGRADFDVAATWADLTKLESKIGPRPMTDLATGLQNFVDWYLGYRNRII